MLELRAASLADTHAIAGVIAAQARSGDMIVLSGEMGAGKTAFARGFGRALGIEEAITSPTFTLVHSYDIVAAPHTARARTLHHADLYRLDRTVEIADLALEELAEFDGIVLVEWGDVVDSMFGDHLVVHLEYEAPGDDGGDSTPGADGGDGTPDDGSDEFAPQARRIEVSASGSSWAHRWSAVAAGCEAFTC